MATGGVEMFSLVEWLIFGFIGSNMTLAGVYLLQRGLQRITNSAKE